MPSAGLARSGRSDPGGGGRNSLNCETKRAFCHGQTVVVRFKCLSAISKRCRDRHVFSDGVLEFLADEAEAIDAEECAAMCGGECAWGGFPKPIKISVSALRGLAPLANP